MTLPNNHAISDVGHTADHNAIATQVNTNTTDIAARITTAAANAAYSATAEGAAIQSVAHNANGNIALTVVSNWGVNAQGSPYHDPAGAAPGEEAVVGFDSTGALTVSKINQ